MSEFEPFDFSSYPFKLSGQTVNYICPKCKYKFQAPIEAVLEFEEEDAYLFLLPHTQSVTNVVLISVFLSIIYLVEAIITFTKRVKY